MRWMFLTKIVDFCSEYHCKIERFVVYGSHSSLTGTLSSDTVTWLWLAPCSSQSRMVSFSTVDWTPTPCFSLTSSTLWKCVCVWQSIHVMFKSDKMDFCILWYSSVAEAPPEGKLWKQGWIPERVIGERFQLKTKVDWRDSQWVKSPGWLRASAS